MILIVSIIFGGGELQKKWPFKGVVEVAGESYTVVEEVNTSRGISHLHFRKKTRQKNVQTGKKPNNLRDDNFQFLLDLFSLCIDSGTPENTPEKVKREDFCNIVLTLINLESEGSPVYFRSLFELIFSLTMRRVLKECFEDTFGSMVEIRKDVEGKMLITKCINKTETTWRVNYFLHLMHQQFICKRKRYLFKPLAVQILEYYANHIPVEILEYCANDILSKNPELLEEPGSDVELQSPLHSNVESPKALYCKTPSDSDDDDVRLLTESLEEPGSDVELQSPNPIYIPPHTLVFSEVASSSQQYP